ncbi:MAG: hypothetical protein ACJAZN_001553 [Planctomycetota bacterium]|jgi:hypothetical protein
MVEPGLRGRFSGLIALIGREGNRASRAPSDALQSPIQSARRLRPSPPPSDASTNSQRHSTWMREFMSSGCTLEPDQALWPPLQGLATGIHAPTPRFGTVASRTCAKDPCTNFSDTRSVMMDFEGEPSSSDERVSVDALGSRAEGWLRGRHLSRRGDEGTALDELLRNPLRSPAILSVQLRDKS